MKSEVDFYYDGDCQSNFPEIQQMFVRLFINLGGAATSTSGTVTLENINVTCGDSVQSSLPPNSQLGTESIDDRPLSQVGVYLFRFTTFVEGLTQQVTITFNFQDVNPETRL